MEQTQRILTPEEITTLNTLEQKHARQQRKVQESIVSAFVASTMLPISILLVPIIPVAIVFNLSLVGTILLKGVGHWALGRYYQREIYKLDPKATKLEENISNISQEKGQELCEILEKESKKAQKNAFKYAFMGIAAAATIPVSVVLLPIVPMALPYHIYTAVSLFSATAGHSYVKRACERKLKHAREAIGAKPLAKKKLLANVKEVGIAAYEAFKEILWLNKTEETQDKDKKTSVTVNIPSGKEDRNAHTYKDLPNESNNKHEVKIDDPFTLTAAIDTILTYQLFARAKIHYSIKNFKFKQQNTTSQQSPIELSQAPQKAHNTRRELKREESQRLDNTSENLKNL